MIKFRAECFEAYGLNKYRNFMNDYAIRLEDNEELFEFMADLVWEHECENNAVFAIAYDDSQYAAMRCEEPGEVEILSREEFDVEFFQKVDAQYRLCCYGLLIELAPHCWKVISEDKEYV